MKSLLLAILALLLLVRQVQSRAVFAHFKVANAIHHTNDTWEDDMNLAKKAHIDAFALNIAYGDRVDKLQAAFGCAKKVDFKLFFSFDYANDPIGYGPWPMQDVLDLIQQYREHSAYHRHDGKPFVTSFEGPDTASDWKKIKQATGCYFVPNWSSLGTKQAIHVGKGIADGFTSWTAWPWGNEDMNTYLDASYIEALDGVPYMMPVSPWFYANLPAQKKNWLWRGDDLWHTRWQQVFYLRPEFVMVISWNGYGESHYIGPLRGNAYGEFEDAPLNYARGMPHDGWRLFLPYLIDTYKNGIATVEKEGLVAWYRVQPAIQCSHGNTTLNTAGYFQYEFPPYMLRDEIFFSALLGSRASVTVNIGDTELSPDWKHIPEGGVGLYHGSVSFKGHSGRVSVTIWHSDKIISRVYGKHISTDCTKANGLENWNTWVGLGQSPWPISATPKLALEDQVCINGTGWNGLKDLCKFTCSFGYCPINACYCLATGSQRGSSDFPSAIGYPIAGKDDRYGPLCSWACRKGYCPEDSCGTTQVPPVPRNDTWYLHNTCISGTGEGKLEGLCRFSCTYGYCPAHSCYCKELGPLVGPPSSTIVSATAAPGLDPFIYDGLCDFACSHGYCPSSICKGPVMAMMQGGGGGEIVHIDPGVWRDPTPVMTCSPPCTFVPAPLPLKEPTVIDFPPWTTHVEYSSHEMVKTTFNNGKVTSYPLYYTHNVSTVFQIEPGEYGQKPTYTYPAANAFAATTTAIDVWAITVSDKPKDEVVHMTSSIQPPPFKITVSTTGKYGHNWPPMTTMITPHPYPTTRPKTPDPELNTRPTKITTGSPGPSCTANCGRKCKHFLIYISNQTLKDKLGYANCNVGSAFCLPNCPLCPPGFVAPGIILPPEAINPPPGNKPPGPGNDNGNSPNPTTGDPTSTKTSTGSTSTPERTTLGPVGRLIVETAPSRAEFSHLRGTVAQTLGTKLADLYGSEQRRATDGTFYSKPTTLPATATTGIAVASYELCKQGNSPPCTYGFGVYALASPNWSSFSVCHLKQALYTTDVASGTFKESLKTTPTIGPFRVSNKQDCYWAPGGLSCAKTAFCGKCADGSCDGSYKVFCAVGERGSGPVETVGTCAW